MGNRDHDEFPVPPGVNLDVRKERGANGVGKGIGQSFRISQRIRQADDFLCPVTHAQDDGAPGCVGKSNRGPDDMLERPTVLLELQRLPLIPGEQPLDHFIHSACARAARQSVVERDIAHLSGMFKTGMGVPSIPAERTTRIFTQDSGRAESPREGV